MGTKNLIIWIVVGLLLIGGISFYIYSTNRPAPLDQFATCLKDAGATFYGAFWCPHCQNQKKMFGSSEKLLSYIECSTPDGKSQLQECTDKNVTSYPTWEFADGSRLTGEIPLATLAEKTSCTLP